MIAVLLRSLPAAITLAGLASGLAASMLVLQDRLLAACICILVGNVLDGLDGGLARRMNVASAFGLQLDSLADMVTFGVAPSLLAYRYLSGLGVGPLVLWPVCVGFTVCGALRLARFNLLPAKTSLNDSVGLTISVAGATVSLVILGAYTYGRSLPSAIFPVLLVVLCFLMVSRINYPELGTVFRARWLAAGWIATLVALAIALSPQLAALALVLPYVAFGPLRYAYRWAR